MSNDRAFEFMQSSDLTTRKQRNAKDVAERSIKLGDWYIFKAESKVWKYVKSKFLLGRVILLGAIKGYHDQKFANKFCREPSPTNVAKCVKIVEQVEHVKSVLKRMRECETPGSPSRKLTIKKRPTHSRWKTAKKQALEGSYHSNR